MIIVRIGDSERELQSVSESWINQQIGRREIDNLTICVRVIIKENGLDMTLSTTGCPQGAPGGRRATPKEQEVFDLWEKRGLKKERIHAGNLISFLKQFKA